MPVQMTHPIHGKTFAVGAEVEWNQRNGWSVDKSVDTHETIMEAVDAKDKLQQVRESQRQTSTEILSGMSRGEYETGTTEALRTESGGTKEIQQQNNGKRLSEAGEADTQTVRDVRSGGAEAPRGLQQAIGSEVAVPAVSSADSSNRKKPSETVTVFEHTLTLPKKRGRPKKK